MNEVTKYLLLAVLISLLPVARLAHSQDSIPLSVSSESVFENFITRDGDQLMEGSEEFRFAGANMPGLSLPYDYTLRFPDRLILPTPWEQADGLETAVRMNARVEEHLKGDIPWTDWKAGGVKGLRGEHVIPI